MFSACPKTPILYSSDNTTKFVCSNVTANYSHYLNTLKGGSKEPVFKFCPSHHSAHLFTGMDLSWEDHLIQPNE